MSVWPWPGDWPWYYDRAGMPISMWRWCELFSDLEYKVVARTTVADADLSRTYDVSTVWLGIDYAFGSGPPLIFETMVFGDGAAEADCQRYSTEGEARAGHDAIAALVSATLADPIVMDAHEAREVQRSDDDAESW